MVCRAATETADPTTESHRPMRVSGYLEQPIGEVIMAFSRAGIDELVADALAGALGVDVVQIDVHSTNPVVISAGNADVHLRWRVTSESGEQRDGAATIGLLVVQSGQDPVTELLVALSVSDQDASPVSSSAHRFVDGLIARL